LYRHNLTIALALAGGLTGCPGGVLAGSSLAGSSWTVVVSEQCQLFQIQKITLQADGTADATAVVEDQVGSDTTGGNMAGANTSGGTVSGENPLGGDSTAADLQGTWTQDGKGLHLSLSNGSLTLDGPVTQGEFKAKAMMKTDLGDPLAQDCLLKRN
jgi:hypothetical protein